MSIKAFIIFLIFVSSVIGEETKSSEKPKNEANSSSKFVTNTHEETSTNKIIKVVDVQVNPSRKFSTKTPEPTTATKQIQKVENPFKESKVTPDVVSTSPEKSLDVAYEAKEVKMGNELTPKQVLKQPSIKYEPEKDSFYTLVMTDPDAPSPSNPRAREWHHWLVVNIPENDISKGETISDYVGSAPPKGSGLHRYVFLLFKQPEKLKFSEAKHGPTDGNRAKFNTENFSKKYNLGAPVAGNFFQAQWDDSVPGTHKKLGF